MYFSVPLLKCYTLDDWADINLHFFHSELQSHARLKDLQLLSATKSDMTVISEHQDQLQHVSRASRATVQCEVHAVLQKLSILSLQSKWEESKIFYQFGITEENPN